MTMSNLSCSPPSHFSPTDCLVWLQGKGKDEDGSIFEGVSGFNAPVKPSLLTMGARKPPSADTPLCFGSGDSEEHSSNTSGSSNLLALADNSLNNSEAGSSEQSRTGSDSEETTNCSVLKLPPHSQVAACRAIRTGEHISPAASFSPDSYKISMPQRPVHSGFMGAQQPDAITAGDLSNSNSSDDEVSDDVTSILKQLLGESDERHAEAGNLTGRAGIQGRLITWRGEHRKEYCPMAMNEQGLPSGGSREFCRR